MARRPKARITLRDRYLFPAGRHNRGCSDDLARAGRPVQVLRVLPGPAEYPLQDPAARDGVLSGQRVEQVEGGLLSTKLSV